ncbi:MAG TPA: hypothetical protein VIR02_06785, partial [Anaerolineales bacterium]
MPRRSFFIGLMAAIVIIATFTVILRTRSTRPGVEESPPAAPTSPSTSSPSITPGVPLDETSCERPYPDTSIWNVPLDWSIAKIHPMNDLMMRAFFESRDWIGADTSQYTPNMYWVANDTPLVRVQLLENRFRDAMNDKLLQYGQPAGVVWMPLPVEA